MDQKRNHRELKYFEGNENNKHPPKLMGCSEESRVRRKSTAINAYIKSYLKSEI